MCQGSETTSVGFSPMQFSFFQPFILCPTECVSAFKLRMCALRVCCQKAGGGEAEALCGEKVS